MPAASFRPAPGLRLLAVPRCRLAKPDSSRPTAARQQSLSPMPLYSPGRRSRCTFSPKPVPGRSQCQSVTLSRSIGRIGPSHAPTRVARSLPPCVCGEDCQALNDNPTRKAPPLARASLLLKPGLTCCHLCPLSSPSHSLQTTTPCDRLLYDLSRSSAVSSRIFTVSYCPLYCLPHCPLYCPPYCPLYGTTAIFYPSRAETAPVRACLSITVRPRIQSPDPTRCSQQRQTTNHRSPYTSAIMVMATSCHQCASQAALRSLAMYSTYSDRLGFGNYPI